MCDKCQYNRVKVVAMGEEMSSAEKSREFYRRQGECRERERIIKILIDQLTQKVSVWDESLGHAVSVNQADLIIALIKEAN